MSSLLGIDVGGTKVALALADVDGEIRARAVRPTQPSGDPRRDVERLVADARDLLEREGLSPADLEAVGLSLPGPVDARRGHIVAPPNLPGWRDVPVGPWVERALGCPVRLENDANAAALAEWRFGAAQGARDVIYLTMSTGVGGGIVAGGALVRGHGGNAGEVGHIPVEWQGLACACGQHGCLEAYVGGRSWAARLREHTPEKSRVLALAGERAALTPVHVVEAAREGDAFALEELERWNEYLARGIVALAFALAPEMIVLGTIAVAAGEELCFEPVRRLVRAHLWPVIADGLEIRPAALGDDLAFYAAVCAARYGLSPDPTQRA